MRCDNPGMRLGFGKNSGKFYVAIDSNPIQPRSPIHTGRETTHTHTRVRGRLFSAFHCYINSNVMKLHSEIEFKLLQNNINDNFFSQAIL